MHQKPLGPAPLDPLAAVKGPGREGNEEGKGRRGGKKRGNERGDKGRGRKVKGEVSSHFA